MEIMGIAKSAMSKYQARLNNRGGGGGGAANTADKNRDSSSSDDDHEHFEDCRSICKNTSLLILILTELLHNKNAGNYKYYATGTFTIETFSPFPLTFSRMSEPTPTTDRKDEMIHDQNTAAQFLNFV